MSHRPMIPLSDRLLKHYISLNYMYYAFRRVSAVLRVFGGPTQHYCM